METPNDLNQEKESLNLGGIPGMRSPSSDDFQYIPASDFFAIPNNDAFNPELDPAIQQRLDGLSARVNDFSIPPIANMSTPYPNMATGNYNPQSTQDAPDLTTKEGQSKMFNQITNNPTVTPEPKPYIQDPVVSNRNQNRFARYYNNPEFARLGYVPFSNNEDYYNANTDIWDDMSRMIGEFGSLAGSGFASVYRSWGDMGDNYLGPDLTTAGEFEDAMDIGMSSRDGFGAFANNLLLNSAYTVGIIGSVAVEELALLGLEAVTFGGASPFVAARTAMNVGRVGRAITNTFDVTRLAKATRNMLKSFNNADNARQFWASSKAGRRFVTDMFAPETAYALRNWKTMQHAGQNLSNLGKGVKVFGGFYKDVRALNYALAESKLEGGMVYNQQLFNNLAIEEGKGTNITPDVMGTIKENAGQAAYHTTIRNAPLIFLSNQFVLGNALPGFNRTMSRVMGDTMRGAGRRIVQTAKTVGADGKIARNVFKDVGGGLKGYAARLQQAGVKGSFKMAAQASLRYFAANIAEGIQEISQEAISHGTKHYWSAIQDDPLSGGVELHRASVASAMRSQMSGQGFETFMSGFLMGGLVQGPQKLFFQGIPTLYQRVTDKEGFEKHKQRRDQMIANIVKVHNDAWNRMADDPNNNMWDPTKLNFMIQKEVANGMKEAQANDDIFDFKDSQDFGKFHQMYTIFSNGTQDLFRGQLKDLLKLNDKELAEAFPSSKADMENGKTRERLEKMLTQIDQYEESYDRHKNEHRNNFRPDEFEYGSRKWVEETLKYQAFEHARYLAMFTENGFARALERANNIYQELSSDPILSKIAAKDITVLLDKAAIKKEIEMLTAEVDISEDKKEQKEKMERIARLEAINNILYAEENLNKDGSIRKSKGSTAEQKIATLERQRDEEIAKEIPDETKTQKAKRIREIKKKYNEQIKLIKEGKKHDRVAYPLEKLRTALLAYVQHLADTKGDFVDKSRIEEVIKKIIDYKALKGRARIYDKAIEYLANPERLNEIMERTYATFKSRRKNHQVIYEAAIKKYVKLKEKNELLNQINSLGVTPDVREVIEFMENDNVNALRTFWGQKGIIDPEGIAEDKELYGKIMGKIKVWKQSQEVTVNEETTPEEQDAREKASVKESELDAILDTIDVDSDPSAVSPTFGSAESINPVGKSLLQRLYAKESAEATGLGKEDMLNFKQWSNTEAAITANKVYQKLKLLYKANLEEQGLQPDVVKNNVDKDIGFLAWLGQQQTNPTVRSLLDVGGLDFSNFFTTGDGKTPIANEFAKNTLNEGSYILVKQTFTDKITGEVSTYYKLLNRDGSALSAEIKKALDIKPGANYTVYKDAKDAWDRLEGSVSDATPFQFGEQMLTYGTTVTDKDGNEYVIISTPSDINKPGKYKGKINLIPKDKLNAPKKEFTKLRKDHNYTVKEFETKFTVEDINFSKLSNNFSRLRANEAITSRPYVNRFGKDNEENIEDSQERLDLFLQNLTQEESKSLEIVVVKNPDGGKKRDELQFKNYEKNPYVRPKTEEYSIAIRISDPKVVKRLNLLATTQRVPLLETSADGIIAFMASEAPYIENINGKEVDPRFIDVETAGNVFYSSSSNPLTVDSIRRIYGTQAALKTYIVKSRKDNKVKDNEPLVISYSDFVQAGFNLSSRGRFNQTSQPISPKDLMYNKVDGHTVILDNRTVFLNKEKGQRRQGWIVDIDDFDLKEQFISQIEDEMKAQGLYDKARNAGAYVLVTRSESGQYVYTDLKPRAFDTTAEGQAEAAEAVNEMMKQLVDRAADTIKNNLTNTEEGFGNAEVKDPAYNVDFNREFRESMYIKTKPGYTVDISVSLFGKIEINIFNNLTKKPLSVHKTGKNEGKPNPIRFKQQDVLAIAESKTYAEMFAMIQKAFAETEVSDKNSKYKTFADVIDLKLSSFTMTIPEQATAEEILDRTETKLDDRVTFDWKFTLAADGALVQAAMDVPASTAQDPKQKVDNSEENLKKQEDKLEALNKLGLESDKTEQDAIAEYKAEVQKIEKEIAARKIQIFKEGKNLGRSMAESKKLIDTDQTIKSLIARRDSLLGNKIISPNLTYDDITSIEEFQTWAVENLPDFISIQDITTLGNNMLAGGMRVGAFGLSLNQLAGGMNIKGTIYTGATNPFKYHEAFHSVFRMLLSEQDIEKYLSLAGKEVRSALRSKNGYEVLPGIFAKSLKQARTILRNSADQYADMSDTRLNQEIFEEYMADEFEKFKKNRKSSKTDSGIKSLFNRLIEWIRSFFTTYTKNELTTLFENIDAGKYRSAKQTSNRYTEAITPGITVQANALIPYETIESDGEVKGYNYLDGSMSSLIVRNAAAIYIKREADAANGTPIQEIFDGVIKDFAFLYSADNPANDLLSVDQQIALLDYDKAFTEYKEEITDAVKKYLELADIQIDERVIQLEEEEDDQGLRDTSEWDKDASMKGGASSLSSHLRKFIMSTSLPLSETDQGADIFGNTELTNEEPLIKAVDFHSAYNGLLKAVANTTDPNTILQKMYLFGLNNPETNAVVMKFFSTLGIISATDPAEQQVELDNLLEKSFDLQGSVKEPLFFNAMIKGFENFRVDYLFIHRNPRSGKVVTYDAATRDDARSQIDIWGQAYGTIKFNILNKDEKAQKEAFKSLARLHDQLTTNKESITDKELQDKSKLIADEIRKKLGIALSPQWIAYSTLSNVSNLSPQQEILKEVNKDNAIIDSKDIMTLMDFVDQNEDIFSTAQTEGALKKIKALALGNAPFDESIGQSIFKNANGDLVYAHQLPTLHLTAINELNNKEVLEEKQKEEFLEANHLLNSPAFNQLSIEGKLKVLRISGSKEGNIEVTAEGVEESFSEGKTYGDFTSKQFITALLNSYTYLFREAGDGTMKNVVETEIDGKVNQAALAPVLIRVIEASNNGDMINLPVIKAVEFGGTGIQLTDQAINAFVNQIEAEFNRIKKEKNPETATYNKITGEGRLLIGYNSEISEDTENPVYSENGRAFDFYKTSGILKTAKKIQTFGKDVTITTSDSQIERVKQGTQKALVYDLKAAQEYIGFTEEGQVRNALITVKGDEVGTKVKLRAKSLIVATKEQQDEMIDLLGDAIIQSNANEAPSPTHTKDFTIGTTKYWAESDKIVNLLSKRHRKMVYEIVSDETLAEEAEKNLGEYNYENKMLLALETNPEVTFEEAVGDIEQFKKFLQVRLEEQYQNFKSKFDEIASEKDLSTHIIKGLTNKYGSKKGEVAKSAKLLNLTSNLGYNLRQIYFNNYINQTAINEILHGDHAMLYKNATDEMKRSKADAGAGYSAESFVTAPDQGIEHAVDKISLFPFTEPTAASKHSGEDVDVADAQMWMTPKAFLYMWFGFGKLTKNQADLLKDVMEGKDVAYEDLLGTANKETKNYAKMREMINSKKLVYADGKTFVKMSAFTLTKEYTSVKKNGEWVARTGMERLHNLREKMEAWENERDAEGNLVRETLAIAAPVSALKMMKYNVQNIFDATDEGVPFTADNEMPLKAKYMKLQVINPSNKLIITDATQIKTIVTSEHDDTTKVVINGEETDLGRVRASYNNATSQRLSQAYKNKRNLLFNFDPVYATELLKESIKEGDIKPDLYVYLKYAESGLAASNATSNILELFSTDENGNQKYNLNTPSTIKKFEELFLAYFSKGVFSEKVTGMSVALVSDFGKTVIRRVLSVDENGLPDKHEIIRADVWERMEDKPTIALNINEGEYGNDKNITGEEGGVLAALVEQAGPEGVVIIDRLRSDMKAYDEKGEYTNQKYSEAVIPAHHVSVGNLIAKTDKEIPESVSKMFGVRIPSQDNHSTINIKLVDFLPGFYGSSGIFPRELVEVSGADFDIDKLYIQTKNFYEENGEFYEYGKANTIQGQYEDYIRYANEAVTKPGSPLSDALIKYKNQGGKNKFLENKGDSKLYVTDKEQGPARLRQDAFNALVAMDLPITKDDYLEYRKYNKKTKKFDGYEPYEYALSNDILDYKYALMGNDDATATVDGEPGISYRPADLQPLKELFGELTSDDFKPEYFKQFKEDDDLNADDPLAQVIGFTSNKEGAASIGKVVLPNLYLNLLQEYGIKLEIRKTKGVKSSVNLRFDGIDYFDFGEKNEILSNGEKGERTQYIISALITAMTDNAKEQMAYKLGLNKEALGTVANMVALGVPLKTSILLVNQPSLRNLYYQAFNKTKPSDPGIKKLAQTRLANLEEIFEDIAPTAVTTDKLEIGVDGTFTDLQDATRYSRNSKKYKAILAANTKALEDAEYTIIDAANEIAILKQFLIAEDVKSYTALMSSLMNLSKSLGKNFEAMNDRADDIADLGLYLNDKQYEAYTNQRFKSKKPLIDVRPIFKGNTWQATNLKMFNEIKDKILPSAFLTQTEGFNLIRAKLFKNLNQFELSTVVKEKLTVDLLGYLTMKGYQKKLGDSDSKYQGSLSNSLIYDQNQNGEKITDIVARLKREESNNYFLERFIITSPSDKPGNMQGISTIDANTFGKMSDDQKILLQTGFARLYGNPMTKRDAMSIIHYVMVKDGFTYGLKSILDALTPVTYDLFLEQINTVEKAMRGDRQDDALFESTFGLNFDELVEEFMNGYLTSTINKKLLQTKYNPMVLIKGNQSVETMAFFKRHEVEATPEKIFIFPDNLQDNNVDGNRVIRYAENSIGFPIKRDMGDQESSYYTDKDIQEFTAMMDQVRSEILQKSKGKTLVFPTKLINSKELDDIKKASKKVYAELKNTLDILGYDIEASVAKAKGTTTNERAAKADGFYIDETGPTTKLVVNTYPTIKVKETEEKVSERKPRSEKGSVDLTSSGFQTETIFTTNDQIEEVVLPQVLKIKVNDKLYRYFVLDKYATSIPGNKSRSITVTGNYAEYVETPLYGSRFQNGNGFMFGERGTEVQIVEFVKKLNKDTESKQTFDEYSEPDFNFDALYDTSMSSESVTNLDAAGMAKLGAEIEVANGQIKVDGKNSQDIKKKDLDEYVDNNVEEQTGLDMSDPVDLENIDISGIPEDQYTGGKEGTSAFLNAIKNKKQTLEEKHPDIVNFWDAEIDNNPKNKAKLAEQGIRDLDDFIKFRIDGTYSSDQEYLDQIKKCNL